MQDGFAGGEQGLTGRLVGGEIEVVVGQPLRHAGHIGEQVLVPFRVYPAGIEQVQGEWFTEVGARIGHV
ncbi:hypothetical protein GCM10010198_75350 [Nocardia seriolae]|nr:hypothetical protein NSER024013_24430 [Nocardia seriolae]